MEHVGDSVLGQDLLELGQHADVGSDPREGVELGFGQEQAQAMVVVAHVEGDDARALVDESSDRPGSDAARRPGHQIAILHAPHRPFSRLSR